MPNPTCKKCSQKVPARNLYLVVVSMKLKAHLCSDCYNKWFDLRDKVVAETFGEYLDGH